MLRKLGTMAVTFGLVCFAALANAGVITATRTAAPASVNLTNEGTLDWAYWQGDNPGGAGTSASLNKFDQMASPQISLGNLTAIGAVNYHDFGGAIGSNYSWSNGSNTPVSSGNGLVQDHPSAAGRGFQLTLPATTTARTVQYYVGGFNTTSTLTATLSDGSATTYVNPVSTSGGATYRYEITYAASSPGQTLTLDWTRGVTTLGAAPNIFVSAATLAATPGNLTIQNANFEQNDGTNGQLHWTGSARYASHASFPQPGNASLGSAFGFTMPNLDPAQQILTGRYEPGTFYTFQGYAVDNDVNDNDLRFILGYLNDSNAFVELAGQTYSFDNLDWTLLDGVSYRPELGNPEIGRQIVLRLRGIGSASGVWFDNVSLTAVPVPEPSSIALLAGGGLMALLIVRRKARRRV